MTTYKCKNCDTLFTKNTKRKYCSPKCFYKSRVGKKVNHAGTFKKGHCGYWKGKKMSKKTCKKLSDAKRGSKHYNWKGGKTIGGGGYFLIYVPNHPHPVNRNYIYEHRHIMEQHLNRYLDPKEVVHHINGDKFDNRICNLQLLSSKSLHRKVHIS